MSHHAPFQSLSPLSWTNDIAGRDPSALNDLLTSTLAEAQLLIDSIPTATPHPSPSATTTSTTTTGRARSHTDSSVRPPSSSGNEEVKGKGNNKTTEQEKETTRKLQREWKDLKVQQGGGKAGNPHGIVMYKMPAKDGKYAWFARRSLHRAEGGIGGFDKWEAALRREMQVTLDRVAAKPGMEPGTGNIRGIGAERRLEVVECEGGRMDLYHVSTRFPGPTTPRDFVTLIMMPKEEDKKEEKGQTRAPRQFMIVSRPCDYPDCPPRSGFIRGTYESVEVIREVPVEKPLRRVRSSVDFNRDEVNGTVDGEHLSKEAVLRAAKRAVGDEVESEGEGSAAPFPRTEDGDDGDTEMAIEWLMVTRSDPGGSVPKFMVEKGTPGGVISDAGKFVSWLSSQSMDDLMKISPPRADQQETKPTGDQQETKPTGESPAKHHPGQLPPDTAVEDHVPDGEPESQEAPSASSSGIYGMLSSALGMATSAVASRVAAFAPSTKATESDFSDDESDTTSEADFASADEGSNAHPHNSHPTDNLDTISATDTASTRSAHSTFSDATTAQTLSRELTPSATVSQAKSHHEKQLSKLQNRMRKAQEKLERKRAKHNGDTTSGTSSEPALDPKEAKQKEKDDQALAKLREKHAREIARQEEKYQRELQRLAAKRAAEERKAEARRKKAAEREERQNLAMELDRVKAERDVTRKEVEMLRERVGELQGQCTRLAARLGREGVNINAVGGDGDV